MVIRQSFPFQNNSKHLDPSYIGGYRSLGLLSKGKTCNIAKFHGTDLFICSHSREEITPSYSRINMVNSHIIALKHYYLSRVHTDLASVKDLPYL